MSTEILGQRVYGDVIDGEQFDTFILSEVMLIDVFKPKKNYVVPRFYTVKGIFTVILTLDACKQIFIPLGFKSLDSNILVNIDHINYVKVERFGNTAFFDGGVTANVIGRKLHLVEHLITKD
ncbi:dipeptidyl aminopeptidase [Paenibacillus sp. KS-LC4]|uniref:dipeptidyl aminopeptidase n=1 Tax=Paenibacillus sp. KS-LC4 TaxID=2979727 RepID=UPI0030D533FB